MGLPAEPFGQVFVVCHLWVIGLEGIYVCMCMSLKDKGLVVVHESHALITRCVYEMLVCMCHEGLLICVVGTCVCVGLVVLLSKNGGAKIQMFGGLDFRG